MVGSLEILLRVLFGANPLLRQGHEGAAHREMALPGDSPDFSRHWLRDAFTLSKRPGDGSSFARPEASLLIGSPSSCGNWLRSDRHILDHTARVHHCGSL